ncbi:MAG: HNH endonuclease [Turicibacter sp.]|nr:HNH endonuclease [Turicibacter sp.]
MILVEKRCELCERSEIKLTKHHIIPKEEGGTEKDIVMICSDCHRQIHALYSNQELALRLFSIEALKNDEKLKKFIRFIKKQPATKRAVVTKSRDRKRKK